MLGLAAGGGQQMALCAAKGAKCTVLDYSAKQLEADAIVAKREGYEITLVQADMTKPLPFEDESFDLIIHPVSNCYIEEVLPLWKECHRVLKPGGRLLSGLEIGTNYIVDENEERVINHLPFNPLRDPEQAAQLEQQDGGIQFSHTIDEQLRGQLQVGFTLIDLFEDYNGEGRLAELHIPSFVATYAKK